MPLRIVSEAELEEWIRSLGETYSDPEVSFQAFEQKFLVAYNAIFDSIARVASLKESGADGDAELAMSQWVDPERLIVVGVVKKNSLKPALLSAARIALAQISEKFAVGFDAYPTQVYVFPNDETLVTTQSLEPDLRAFGLETSGIKGDR